MQYQVNQARSFTTASGISSWFQMQLDITEQIFDYAKANGVYLIVHNGDLFEDKNRINVKLYNKVWEFFKEKSKEGFVIYFNTGNHDLYSMKGEGSLKPFSDIVNVVNKPKDIAFNTRYKIRIIPYNQLNGNLQVDNNYYNILFTHENIDVLTTSPLDIKIETPNKSQIFKEWDLVLNGHIHKPQEYKNIINIGSPCIQDWGESGENKRFIHFKDKDIINILTRCPQFHTLDSLTPRIISKIKDDNYNYYRIDISSSEVSNPIFEKFNVSYRIVKTENKVLRLKESINPEEELLEYINIKNESLDKNTLLKIGKSILERKELHV